MFLTRIESYIYNELLLNIDTKYASNMQKVEWTERRRKLLLCSTIFRLEYGLFSNLSLSGIRLKSFCKLIE